MFATDLTPFEILLYIVFGAGALWNAMGWVWNRVEKWRDGRAEAAAAAKAGEADVEVAEIEAEADYMKLVWGRMEKLEDDLREERSRHAQKEREQRERCEKKVKSLDERYRQEIEQLEAQVQAQKREIKRLESADNSPSS